MKKYILLWLGLATLAGLAVAQDRSFVLATAGDVNAALVERVHAYLEDNSDVVVRLGPAVPMESGQSLEAIGRQAAATLGPADHSIIVLAQATVAQPQGVCLPDVRFAVLNLARLETGVDAARLERRAGQEGLRVMSMLLAMSPCPFPLCVLVGYEKTEDLDGMSSNYCPPCRDRFTRVARDAGLRLIERSDPARAAAPVAADADAPAGEAMPTAEPEPEGLVR